jgi:hypothetical protein
MTSHDADFTSGLIELPAEPPVDFFLRGFLAAALLAEALLAVFAFAEVDGAEDFVVGLVTDFVAEDLVAVPEAGFTAEPDLLTGCAFEVAASNDETVVSSEQTASVSNRSPCLIDRIAVMTQVNGSSVAKYALIT